MVTDTDEPEHFLSEHSAKVWWKKKAKELRWLLYKGRMANTPEQEAKAARKLESWLRAHPKLSDAIAKRMEHDSTATFDVETGGHRCPIDLEVRIKSYPRRPYSRR